jgi:hypothetical protein
MMALGDCLDLHRAFEKADAEFRAGIDRLIPLGEPGNGRESGRVIGDAALYQLAELAMVRRKARDAYDLREKQPAVSVEPGSGYATANIGKQSAAGPIVEKPRSSLV